MTSINNNVPVSNIEIGSLVVPVGIVYLFLIINIFAVHHWGILEPHVKY